MTGKVNIDSVKNIAYDADAADADADADNDDDAHKMITLKKRKRDIQLNKNVLIFLLTSVNPTLCWPPAELEAKKDYIPTPPQFPFFVLILPTYTEWVIDLKVPKKPMQELRVNFSF